MISVGMVSGGLGSEYNWGIKNYITNLSENIGKEFRISIKETGGFLRYLRSENLSGFDIVHLSSQTFGHLSRQAGERSVITCHDMMAFSNPGLFDKRRQALLSRIAIKGMEKCGRIISVSEFIKNEIIRHMKVDEDNINVIHSGISEAFRPQRKKESDYIVYFGSEEKRKNISALIDAFVILKRTFPELKLVKNYDNPVVREKIRSLGIQDDVMITGNLSEKQMAEYYTNAKAFVYPSLFEGFGFTPLEAMACGCPVASSNAAAMPEILGDAPVYFNPMRPEEIAGSVASIINDKTLSKKMSRKSLSRAKKFSWKTAAKKTEGVYREVLG